MSAGEILYIPYLLALLASPPVMYWRRGLVAALVLVAAELGFVLILFFALSYLNLLPPSPDPGPMPQSGILEHLKRSQAEAFAHVVVLATMLVVVPWIAALIGGVLSLAGAAALAARRYYTSSRETTSVPSD